MAASRHNVPPRESAASRTVAEGCPCVQGAGLIWTLMSLTSRPAFGRAVGLPKDQCWVEGRCRLGPHQGARSFGVPDGSGASEKAEPAPTLHLSRNLGSRARQ